MPGRPTENTPGFSDAAQAFADMLAAALRGAAKTTLGAPGDIEKLGRAGINLAGGSVDPDSVLSSSEDMDKHLPPLKLLQELRGGKNPYEDLGGFLPINAAGPLLKGTKLGTKALVEALRIPEVTAAEQASRRGALKTLGAVPVAAALGENMLSDALRTGTKTEGAVTKKFVKTEGKQAAPGLSDSAATKAGLLIPIFAAGNKIPARNAELLKQVDLAETLHGKGASAADIWHETGFAGSKDSLVATPTGLRQLSPRQGAWSHEIHPQGEPFHDMMTMGMNDKIDLYNKYSEESRIMLAVMLDREARPRPPVSAADLNIDAYLTNFKKNRAPLEQPKGTTIGDALEYDQLRTEYPHIGNMEFGTYSTPNKSLLKSLGTAENGSTKAVIHPGTLIQSTTGLGTPTASAGHEINHVISKLHGLPGGGSPEWMALNGQYVDPLNDVLDALRKRSEYGSLAQDIPEMVQSNMNLAPYDRYRSLIDELKSNMVAGRMGMSEETARKTLPEFTPRKGAVPLDRRVWEEAIKLVDPSSFYHGPEAGSPQKLMGVLHTTPDEKAQQLIENLRKLRAIP
jgi:hypothetical protein